MKKAKAKRHAVTMRLTETAIDAISGLVSKVTEIKRSKGDYSEVQKQEIADDCIILGAEVLEKQLEQKTK